MPRINDEMLDCVFYLYRNRKAAENGEDSGGTGFWAAYTYRNSNILVIFAVSNKHVVASAGCSVIRVNTPDGKVDIFETEPDEWYFTNQDDLAIIHLNTNLNVQKIKTIPLNMFVTKNFIESNDLGLGDEVFMIGRFIRHDGKLTNIPSVRFGTLSIPLAPIEHPTFGVQESFGVEMRSMCGYSGSPVFIYPSSWNMNTGNTKLGPVNIYLLGVEWGHILDHSEIKEKRVPIEEQGRSPTRTVPYVPVNTGMNGVVPAWRLEEMIKNNPWTPAIKREEDAIAKRESEFGPSAALDIALPATDENPNHLEDFRRLVDVAARKKPQGDQS